MTYQRISIQQIIGNFFSQRTKRENNASVRKLSQKHINVIHISDAAEALVAARIAILNVERKRE